MNEIFIVIGDFFYFNEGLKKSMRNSYGWDVFLAPLNCRQGLKFWSKNTYHN